MKKPNKCCELKMQNEDIAEAIEDWLNKAHVAGNIVVKSVRKTRSEKYMMIVEFE